MKKFLKILMIAIAVLVVLGAAAMMLLPTILNEAMGGTTELDAPHVHHEVESGTAGNSHTTVWFGRQNDFLESMAEATSSVEDALEGNIIYINVMNNLSVDCDCNGNPDAPDVHDIGILASTDPVALDQACVDLIYNAENNGALVARIEERNAERVLKYGEEIGLGVRTYYLVNIDGA